ncbi:hypothetical protein B0H67DRAFT_550712 [Lasiosphaeris hirsuta]|uniref:Uncharacterized protein n=1 Tax=Lasiosphaeris hirsuta TaxID=260670 RepID=A0AA40E5V7_9PEZI|nr:hypothetical protein B0H67DRAFT_550712 [Lasiosphaeris hirsuta]
MDTNPLLIDVQKQTLFMLPYYRQEKWDDYTALPTSEKEEGEDEIQVPIHPGGVNAWPGLNDGDFNVDERSPNEDGAYDMLADFEQEELEEVKKAVRVAAQTLPKTFKFVKLLGWGGEGVAVLFRRWDRKGEVKEYVAKFKSPDGFKTPHDEARRMKVSTFAPEFGQGLIHAFL